MSMYSISLFTHKYSKFPKKITHNLDEIIRGLLHPQIGDDKANLPLWSPTTFSGSRLQKNAEQLSMLVYDIDDGASPYTSWTCFRDLGYTVIAHTSYSYTQECEKYRIILPLARPIPPKDWYRASLAAVDLWTLAVGVGQVDHKTLRDSARMYYRYSWRTSGQGNHKSDYHIADPLDLEYSHIEIKSRPVVTPVYRGAQVTYNHAIKDPTIRESIGIKAGGRVVGNHIKHITCPRCGRQDVYYTINISIQPNATYYPKCSHLNSCGWRGKFEDII